MTVLLPGWARHIAVSVLACCAIFIGAVGAVVLRLQAAQRLDTAVNVAVQRAVGQHEALLHLVAGLGERVDVGVATLVLVGLCLARHRLNGALLAAIAIPVAPALTEYMLKPLFALPHPEGAFPSGHTTAAFAVATVVAVLLATSRTRISALWRLAIALAALLAGAAVVVAVMGLGIHTLTDALGGAAVGAGVTLSVALLLDLPLAQRLLTLVADARGELRRRFRSGPVKHERPDQVRIFAADLPDAGRRDCRDEQVGGD
ncbi:MAG: phosphatase PAP2 family protein [Streptosporangiaceae bacterium]